MPRLKPETRSARRQEILDAARRCFARRGFSATTIADLCEEAGVSAGGIYTHFENKHAIAAAIGSEATVPGDQPLDLAALRRRLSGPEGFDDARLDLQLWAESLHDPVLHEMVVAAMDHFRDSVVAADPASADGGRVAVVEALVLGAEVQRALGRRIDAAALASAIELFASTSSSRP